MTFDELVKAVAERHGVSETKTRGIINLALRVAKQAALLNDSAPRFHGIGRFSARPMRTKGITPHGAWHKAAPRKKLTLRTSRSVSITTKE